jgi:hypothetical protein
VVPFNVNVTGNVPVVPVGIAFATLTVKYPTGYIRRKPSEKFTASSVTLTLVVLKYGIPLTLVVTLKYPII